MVHRGSGATVDALHEPGEGTFGSLQGEASLVHDGRPLVPERSHHGDRPVTRQIRREDEQARVLAREIPDTANVPRVPDHAVGVFECRLRVDPVPERVHVLAAVLDHVPLDSPEEVEAVRDRGGDVGGVLVDVEQDSLEARHRRGIGHHRRARRSGDRRRAGSRDARAPAQRRAPLVAECEVPLTVSARNEGGGHRLGVDDGTRRRESVSRHRPLGDQALLRHDRDPRGEWSHRARLPGQGEYSVLLRIHREDLV